MITDIFIKERINRKIGKINVQLHKHKDRDNGKNQAWLRYIDNCIAVDEE